ncbi:MAG: radical SAM protein [Desulfobacteraceae bacterium IS3]|nr:MAG: radical SAM protein [Desulfobacteraceae bacterium IS3]
MNDLKRLSNCTICPRGCGADRFSDRLGYCRTGAGFEIGSVCVHKGEEPVLSGSAGICNVFFTRCNLQCIYCQNYQISRNQGKIVSYPLSLGQVIEKIISVLDTGIDMLGFVSPSHCIVQMKSIIAELHRLERHPVIVMNTNAYDRVETLGELEGLVDVWLPDFKYMDPGLSKDYSDALDYPEIAAKSIREMYRQKGAALYCNDEGLAESGLIIRHLILPGHIENSLQVLRYIAEEISASVHISLMSQYYPPEPAADHPIIGRTLRADEYERVREEAELLGFHRGWMQEPESSSLYRPDFVREHPFK